MAYLTGVGMGRIPGIAHMKLMAVLGREYRREIDPNTTSGLHHIASDWNERINYQIITPEHPFGAENTFTTNYQNRYPDEALRISDAVQNALRQKAAQEIPLQAMDNANLAEALGTTTPTSHEETRTKIERMMQEMGAFGIDQAAPGADRSIIGQALNDRFGSRENDRLAMQNLVRDGHDSMKMDTHKVSDHWEPVHQATFEDHLIDWLSERPDLAVWLDSLGESLSMDTEDTFEVALRIAMNVAYKENEAQMARLNKKLQDMEESMD